MTPEVAKRALDPVFSTKAGHHGWAWRAAPASSVNRREILLLQQAGPRHDRRCHLAPPDDRADPAAVRRWLWSPLPEGKLSSKRDLIATLQRKGSRGPRPAWPPTAPGLR